MAKFTKKKPGIRPFTASYPTSKKRRGKTSTLQMFFREDVLAALELPLAGLDCPRCGRPLRDHAPICDHADCRVCPFCDWNTQDDAVFRGQWPPLEFIYDDGGAVEAGHDLDELIGDCVTRAIAIATGTPYDGVLAVLRERNLDWLKRRKADRYQDATLTVEQRACPKRTGWKAVFRKYLTSELGWTWTPCMSIGQRGRRTRLKAGELPGGRLIVEIKGHTCAVIDGVVHDTHMSALGAVVLGYYEPPADA